MHIDVEALFEFVVESFARFFFDTTGFSAKHLVVAKSVTSKFDDFVGTNAIATDEFGAQTQRFHLLDHGSSNSIHAAKEHDIRLFAFQCGQDSSEVGGFVGGEFTTYDGRASGFGRLFKLISHALSVSGTVVNDSDLFAFEIIHSIAAQRATQMHIVSHHAEGGFVTLASEFRVGRRRGNLGNACIAVDFGSRDRGARVQVTHYAIHFGIHQFLRCSCALLGICCIVFSQQLKLDFFAANGHAFGIEFFDGQASAVFVVFAQVGDGATQRCDVTDFDDFLSHAHGSGDTQGQGHC